MVLAFLILAVTMASGVAAALDVALLVSLIFACVLLHEFGHITMARRFGIETPEVVLLPIGGLAKLKRIPNEPKQELAVAIAGPLVNFAIFGLLVLWLGGWPDWGSFARLSQGEVDFVQQLAVFNLFVGLFNLLPAFPMDGGRILRASLALTIPRHRATRIAARIGQALAVTFAFLGLMSGNVLLIAIGIFIFMAAASEAQLEKIRYAVGGTPVSHVMVTGQARFLVSDPITKAADAILNSDNEEFPVLNGDGSLAGFLLRSDILDSLGQAGAEPTAGQKMRTDLPVVSLHYRAEKAAEKIAGGAAIVGVVDGEGHFAGLVNWRNLVDAMTIDEALAHRG